MSALIFDRTQADTDRAAYLIGKIQRREMLTEAEQAEYNAGLRGCYNITDLNRVEAKVRELAEVLRSYGYSVDYTVPLKGASVLPSGYTEVEYIQSSGTQYVDTGVSVPEGCRIKCKMAFTSLSSTLSIVFGSHDAASPYYRNFLAATSSTWELGAYGTADFGSPITNTVYEIDANTKSGEIGCSVNGNAYTIDQSIAPSTQRSALSVYLFALHYADGLFPAKMKAWWYKMYVGNSLVRDFIPCKSPSGAVGLYDTVNGTFYGNSGTGAFTAGPEISALEDREWQRTDTMLESDVLLYLANIAALRNVIQLPPDIPPIPTIDRWIDWVAANDIERIVFELDRYIYGIVPLFRRCGTFRAGKNAQHLLLAKGVN